MSLDGRAAFLHAAAAAIMAYGYLNLPDLVVKIHMSEMKGGHFQFLTVQGLCLAWTTMVVSLGCDLIPSSKLLRMVKRTLLMIALPVAIVISVVYWSLITFMPHMILLSDPEATVPTSSSRVPGPARLPMRVDLAVHAAPAISMFIDFYFLEVKYPKKASIRGAILVAALFGSWYSCWVEYCASFNGFFPYPFLTNSPFHIRVAIYIVATALAAVSFIGLNATHP
ncbi:FAR-17a/AIG1-like protein [Trametes punicea]|nr:FAR-17a/AIG1-like protein [Trametes punicea]